jgi:hypothetical protein
MGRLWGPYEILVEQVDCTGESQPICCCCGFNRVDLPRACALLCLPSGAPRRGVCVQMLLCKPSLMTTIHFPASNNPARFASHLSPVFVRANRAATS